MLGLLYDFFLDNLYRYSFPIQLDDISLSIGGMDMSLGEYLAFLLSLVSFIIIIVLCCLFIYRLIRVVGRLFMGA